jgi:hypothetical protein
MTHLDRAQRYHQAIRAALLKEWDPIGLGEIPEAVDEYDAYVSPLYKLLVSERPKCEIIDYLWWLETEHMGLIGDRQGTERFADRLLQLREMMDSELRK